MVFDDFEGDWFKMKFKSKPRTRRWTQNVILHVFNAFKTCSFKSCQHAGLNVPKPLILGENIQDCAKGFGGFEIGWARI